MKLTSVFDEPIRRLEKEFFTSTRRSDGYSWLNDRRSIQPRPELLDKRYYNETIESKIEDEEILKNTENELVLKISCIDFRPQEITVTVEDNQLLIEGIQERLTEHGKTRRHFRREIQLPNDSLTKEMNCTAKLNGLLNISIPRKPAPLNKNEKIIPIRLENNSTSNLKQNTFKSTNQNVYQSTNQSVNQNVNETITKSDSQTKMQFQNQKQNQVPLNQTTSQFHSQISINQTIPSQAPLNEITPQFQSQIPANQTTQTAPQFQSQVSTNQTAPQFQSQVSTNQTTPQFQKQSSTNLES